MQKSDSNNKWKKNYDKKYLKNNLKKDSVVIRKELKENIKKDKILITENDTKKQIKVQIKKIKKNNAKRRGVITGINKPGNVMELKKVNKYYTNGQIISHILKDINLEIPEGKLIVILGPSGSGKTTLLNVISGLDRSTDGDIIAINHNLSYMNDRQLTEYRRYNVGFIFQEYYLLPNLTARENVEMGSYLQKDKKKIISADSIFEKIGMTEHSKKMPSQLSGGQQQRVSIARALTKNPKILFADEPTGALDRKVGIDVLKTLQSINKDFGMTVILVTHNVKIAKLAHLVIKMKDGKIEKLIKNKTPLTVEKVNWE